MVMYLKFFFLNISLPLFLLSLIPRMFPIPLTNFFTQTYGVQSCGLELLEMGWNPGLIAAPRELTVVLVR